MKIIKPALLIAIVVATIFFITANKPPMKIDYDEKWKQVDSLTNLRQPRSALEIVDEIYRLAKSEDNTPQLIRANLFRIRLMSDFEEDHMVKAIENIRIELKDAKFPERELLHSILGDLYRQYFDMNSYQILNRGRIPGFEGDDIRMWDAHTLLTRAAGHFDASIEPAAQLQGIDLNQFSIILQEREDSKLYRPTLFDFLAHRAIGFYATSMSGITIAADQYRPDQPDFFKPASEFVDVEIPSQHAHTHNAKVIAIYRQLLQFHLNGEPQALIDADLSRLDFIWNNTIVADADSLYLAALTLLHRQHADVPYSTDVAFALAQFHSNRGLQYNPQAGDEYRWEIKTAVEICEDAISRFPESRGAKNCRALLDQLTLPSISIQLEQAILPAKHSLGLVEWKNQNRVFIRLLKMDRRQFVEMTARAGASETAKQLINIQPIQSWNIEVPNDMDFQRHSAEIIIPDLSEGFYVLLASGSEDFDLNDHAVVWAEFWVTGITFIAQRQPDGGHELFVLDRDKGTPMRNVTVNVFTRDYDFRTRQHTENLHKTYTTDRNGFIKLEPVAGQRAISVVLEFINKGDQYYPSASFHLGAPRTREPRPEMRTFFFTDRAIYRPGQTVYFKGIMLERTGEEQKIKSGESTTVDFFDVNFQKISSQSLTTNEYGSVHGSFTIPTGVLTGVMTIRSESGNVSFRVEDYKRPTFEVTFEPVQGSYKLNEEVTFEGKATGFAGNAIDGAEVKYRVVRNSFFPFRWSFYPGFFPRQAETEMLSGTTVTDANGDFSVTFDAIPDHSFNRKFKPVFRYTVHASVTDIGGETQPGEATVSVGHEALMLNVDIPEKLDRSRKQQFTLEAVNYNGQKQETTVEVQIHKLNAPDRLLTNRMWNRPDVFLVDENTFRNTFPGRVYDDELNPENWEKSDLVFSKRFETAADSILQPDGLSGWNPGKYAITLSATDIFGNEVETVRYFTVFSPTDRRQPLLEHNWFAPLKSSGEPGEEASFLIGTSARSMSVLYEIQHRGVTVHREWMRLGNEQKLIKVPIIEEYRGNFSILTVAVIDGREFRNSQIISVPFTNKQLDLAFETFRTNLEPGSKEEWTITIRDKKGDKVAAQMLASMYDASLDAFTTHGWAFDLYRQNNQTTPWQSFSNFTTARSGRWNPGTQRFAPFIYQQYDQLNWFGFSRYGQEIYSVLGGTKVRSGAVMTMVEDDVDLDAEIAGDEGLVNEMIPITTDGQPPQPPTPPADPFEGMHIRRDFNETAFFYPDLRTNEDGDVVISFTLPESFTRWRFMGLGYTKDLMTGMLKQEFTASKNLMVMPNQPRFFRMGDTLWFSTRISNLSDEDIEGSAMLEFFDAVTMQPISADLQLSNTTQSFAAEANRSAALRWRIIIPEKYDVITYRIRATAGNYTDGEERIIPALPNRMLVTESLPMHLRGGQTKTFRLEKLLGADESATLSHQNLTLEFTSNPAWYAIQALPVISEPAHKNALSVFAAFYANSIAFHIANDNPRIKRVFDTWKTQTPETFMSNLEKNQELKALLLEQTPWVMQAQNEAERKQRIALLFDLNNMQHRLEGTLRMLQQMQSPNGGFPWFEGMRDNRYITQQIVMGIGKMHSMGILDVQNDPQLNRMVNQAVRYLEERIREDYERLLAVRKDKMEENNLSSLNIQFLYARSFYPFIKLNPNSETAFNYFRHQASTYWQSQNIYLQGMIAIGLSRYEIKEAPQLIVKSLRERSLASEEMGMYWRMESGFMWWQAPVETQAMMIGVFDEVANDGHAVELMKIWLLKQKQTQDWRSTRATVEAVTALFTKGSDLLAGDRLVEIEIGNQPLNIRDMATVEAGTGYFQTSWGRGEITPEMGEVTVSKSDDGIAWGALYWQYFEDLDKITPHETPLSLSKQLYVERNTPQGTILEAVNEGDTLKIGDKVIVRIELRVDRDMEYVHMQDMRASAFEPVNVLSGYRFGSGLGYYESTRDAATHFFFDFLRKGTYVFEYPLVVSQSGNFSNGISTIQCMYAPEFTSHSEGIRVTVE